MGRFVVLNPDYFYRRMFTGFGYNNNPVLGNGCRR